MQRATATPDAELAEWHCERLIYQSAWATTAGVYRVQAGARINGALHQFRAILKVACAPPAPRDGTGIGHGSHVPASPDYWKRETELFRDGVLDGLGGDFVAPACYLVEEPRPGVSHLWLEYVDETVGPDWPLERFLLAARHLGAFNARYLVGADVPSHVSFSQPDYLRPKLAETLAYRERLMADEVWDDPVVRALFPPDGRARCARLWADRMVSRDIIARLPRVFCHRDPFRSNLIARRLPDGSEQTVAVDWALAGPGHLGEDLWKFVSVTLLFMRAPCSAIEFDEAMFSAYLAGVRDAGWQGDARMVRLGYCAMPAAVVPPLVPLSFARDATFAARAARTVGRPVEEIRLAHRDIVRLTLDCADEARELAQILRLDSWSPT